MAADSKLSGQWCNVIISFIQKVFGEIKMSLVFMVVGTIAWFWKGFTELGICLMLWGIWFENVHGTAAILRHIIPVGQMQVKSKAIIDAIKKKVNDAND